MLSSATKFLRVVIVGLGGLVMTAVLAWIGLWITSETMSRSTEADLRVEVDNYNRLRVVVARENAVLELVNGLAKDRVEWSLVLSDLLRIVPPGVTIVNMQTNVNESLISFSGSALNRSSLVVFEDRLRVLPWVKEVVAPRENLLSRIKPSYNIRLVVDATKIDLSQK
jgi:hypothetical protein